MELEVLRKLLDKTRSQIEQAQLEVRGTLERCRHRTLEQRPLQAQRYGCRAQDRIVFEEDLLRRHPLISCRRGRRCFNMNGHRIIADVSSGKRSERLTQRSGKPITCTSLDVGITVVDAIPRP